MAADKPDSDVQDLQKLFKQLEEPRKKLEPDWFLNVAYFEGDQWIFWNRGRIDRPQLQDWRITLVDNRILPAATSRLARKVKNRPQFVVTPNSYSEDDLNASELGQEVLEDDWIHLDLYKKHFQALQWAEVVSAGFWKIYWDKTKGDYNEDYLFGPDGQPVLNGKRPVRASDAGELVDAEGYTTKTISQGDICVDVLSPFSFYPDPLAETIDDCEIIIEEHVRSVDYIKQHYNKEIEPDTDVPIGVAQSRMFPTTTSTRGASDYRGVTVYEAYGKPGSRWGVTGKSVVWTKNTKLEEKTLDDAPFVGCPYIMFSGIRVPGRFWPTCVTSQLRGPQTELNKIQSQIRENALRIGNPALMRSREANVQYSGVPGEDVLYSSTVPDAVPGYLQPPEMPMYVQNEVERIENSIAEISGIHEVSKASVPSGVTAASAINLLQEADDTRLGPEIQDMEYQLGNAGTLILKTRAKFQDDERLIQSAGEDGEWDINAFRGSMLTNTNVEVQAGSGMPRSQAAKQAAMQEMLQLVVQYGIDINPRDLRKFMRDYGVGGLDNMFATLNTDELQIRREHNYMKSGRAIDINDFDDDLIHIEGHNEFRKGKVYERLGPYERKLVDLHVMSHQERRTQTINQQLMSPEQIAAANGNNQGTPNRDQLKQAAQQGATQ
jgi:hypothetical protein